VKFDPDKQRSHRTFEDAVRAQDAKRRVRPRDGSKVHEKAARCAGRPTAAELWQLWELPSALHPSDNSENCGYG